MLAAVFLSWYDVRVKPVYLTPKEIALEKEPNYRVWVVIFYHMTSFKGITQAHALQVIFKCSVCSKALNYIAAKQTMRMYRAHCQFLKPENLEYFRTKEYWIIKIVSRAYERVNRSVSSRTNSSVALSNIALYNTESCSACNCGKCLDEWFDRGWRCCGLKHSEVRKEEDHEAVLNELFSDADFSELPLNLPGADPPQALLDPQQVDPQHESESNEISNDQKSRHDAPQSTPCPLATEEVATPKP